MKEAKQRKVSIVSFGSDEEDQNDTSPRFMITEPSYPHEMQSSSTKQTLEGQRNSISIQQEKRESSQMIDDGTLGVIPLSAFYHEDVFNQPTDFKNVLLQAIHESGHQMYDSEGTQTQEQHSIQQSLLSGKFLQVAISPIGDQDSAEQMTINESQNKSYGEIGHFENTDTILIRNDSRDGLLEVAQAKHTDMQLIGFMERLFVRQKFQNLNEQLTQIEQLLITVFSQENTDFCDQLVKNHLSTTECFNSTHLDACNQTYSLAEKLKSSLQAFCLDKYDLDPYGPVFDEGRNTKSESAKRRHDSNQHLRQDSFTFLSQTDNEQPAEMYGKKLFTQASGTTLIDSYDHQGTIMHRQVSSGLVSNKFSRKDSSPLNRRKDYQTEPSQADPNQEMRTDFPFRMQQPYYPEEHQQSDSLNQIKTIEESVCELNADLAMESLEQAGDTATLQLNIEELKTCNDLIEKFKLDIEAQQGVIEKQQDELNQLKRSLNSVQQPLDVKEIKSLNARLRDDLAQQKSENQILDAEAAQSSQVIGKMQNEIHKLKTRLNKTESTLQKDLSRVEQGKNYEIDRLKQDYEYLQKRYNEAKQECLVKDEHMESMEKQAHGMLMQAQDDAQDAISYFKQLAVSNKSPRDGRRQHEQQRSHVNNKFNEVSSFPMSLAPRIQVQHRTLQDEPQLETDFLPNECGTDCGSIQQREFRTNRFRETFGGECHERSRTGSNQPKIRLDLGQARKPNSERSVTSRVERDKPAVERLYHKAQLRFELALTSLGQAYDEIHALKSTMFKHMHTARDAYSKQTEQFSVLAYDYLEKIEKFANHEATIKDKVEESQTLVGRLRMILVDKKAHIKMQNDLLGKYKHAMELKNDHSIKTFLSKDRERDGLSQLFLSEFPQVKETLKQSNKALTFVREQIDVKTKEINEERQLNENAKKKIKILQNELESSLQKEQATHEELKQEKTRHDKLTELIKDIWQQEVTIGPGSPTAAISHKTKPMPFSWLTDIKDHVKQLKDMNDFQRDECFQYLQLLSETFKGPAPDETREMRQGQESPEISLSERGARWEQMTRSEIDQQPSELYYCVDQVKFQLQSPEKDEEEIHIQNQEHEEMSFSQRCEEDLNKPVLLFPNSHDLDHQYSITPQSNNAPIFSSYKQPLPTSRIETKPEFSSFGHNHQQFKRHASQNQIKPPHLLQIKPPSRNMSNINQTSMSFEPQPSQRVRRNELHGLLRQEINRVVDSYEIRRQTIVAMTNELGFLKAELTDQVELNKAITEEKEQIIESGIDLQDALEDSMTRIEDLTAQIEEKDSENDKLQGQLGDFEKDLISLQDQMTNIMKLNAEISQASEHWETQFNLAKKEQLNDREVAKHNFEQLAEAHNDQINAYKAKMSEKDHIIKENCEIMERERQFRQHIEHKRQNVQHAEVNTDADLEIIESENFSLKTQLTQVKSDITAVLDQYQEENEKNKALEEEALQEREINKELVQEVTELNDNRNELYSAFEEEKANFMEQLNQGMSVNQELERKIAAVTQMTEELQEQLHGGSIENNQLQGELVQKDNQLLEMHTVIQSQEVELQDKQRVMSELKGPENTQELNQYQSAPGHNARSRRAHSNCRLSSYPTRLSSYPTQSQLCTSQADLHIRGSIDSSALTHHNHQKTQPDLAGYHQNGSDEKKRPTRGGKQLEETSFSPREQYGMTKSSQLIPGCSACGLTQQSPQKEHNTRGTDHNAAWHNTRGTSDNNTACESQAEGKPPLQRKHTKDSLDLGGTHMKSYLELKMKSDVTEKSKKKLKRAMGYMETLITHFVMKLNTKGKIDKKQRNVQQQQSAGQQRDTVLAAKAYFIRRYPLILSGLKHLLKSARHPSVSLSLSSPSTNTYDKDPYAPCTPLTIISTRVEAAKNSLSPTSYDQLTDQDSELINKENAPINQAKSSEVLYHERKDLYQKYLQTGRSLAGICYGGCILINCNKDGEQDEERKKIDQAMQFLSQDSIVFTEKQMNKGDLMSSRLTDTMNNLLCSLSQIITKACQALLAKDPDPFVHQQAMDSIWQKSIELSMDQNHVVGGPRFKNMEGYSSLSCSNSTAELRVQSPSALRNGYAPNVQNEMKEKLKDLEKKLKIKFQHVQKLESALERTVGTHKKSHSDMSAARIGEEMSNPNNRLLNSILRVIRKLKIELHADYLSLGQVNMTLTQSNGPLSRNSTLNVVDTPARAQYKGTTDRDRFTDTGFFDAQVQRVPNKETEQHKHIARPNRNNFEMNESLITDQQSTPATHNKKSSLNDESSRNLHQRKKTLNRIVEELQYLTFEGSQVLKDEFNKSDEEAKRKFTAL